MMETIHEIGAWAPESKIGDMFINPTEDTRIIEAFRRVTQDVMTGYLFHRNEQLFRSEGKTLDEAKERRQIKGAASMLLGHHVHMGTGEGKSTVVLPIVSLVESRVSKQKDVILATASDQSLAELQGHVERLAKELPPSISCRLDKYEYELDEKIEPADDARQQMLKEAILTGSYTEDLHKKLRATYWKDRMRGMMAPARSDMVQNRTGGSRILFAKERDIVFAYEEDPKKFISGVPTVLMDEADIPYRRQTPYVTTTEAQYYSPEEIKDSMGTWLMHYIVSDRLRYPTATDAGDFIPTQNGFRLTDEAEDRVRKINLKSIITHPGNKNAVARAFRQGVRTIAAGLGVVEEKDIAKIETQMRKWLLRTMPSTKLEPQDEGVQIPEEERLTEMQQEVVAIAERIGAQYYSKGVGYLMEEGSGEIKIRDAYIDDLLEGHRHEPLTAISILAMNGKYAFVPPYRTAGRSVHFQTFLSDLGDRARCASGSLLYPDLIDGQIKKDSFAQFLEEATHKHVVLVTPPDIKKAPNPYLSKTHEQAMGKLVSELSSKDQPRLVICYDRLEGEALHDKFTAANPDKRIVYMPIHPTPDQVSTYCSDLADGKIDVLISAGNLGFGVNIVRANGEFPNLHVALYGLPENQLQVVQALGRRRKEGDDFSWHISEPVLYKYIADFKAETSWRERVIQGYLSVEQMLSGYEEVKTDPSKGLPFVADLLYQHEVVRRSDNIFTTYFDQSAERVRSFAFSQMKELIKQDLNRKIAKRDFQRKEDEILHALKSQAAGMSEFYEGPYPHTKSQKLQDLERQVRWMEANIDTIAAQYGLPDSLDEYMQHELAPAGMAFQSRNMRDLVENKLMMHLFGKSHGEPSLIERFVNEWYQSRKTSMQEMTRVLSDNFRLQRMFPVVMRSARKELMPNASRPAVRVRLESTFHPLAQPAQTDTATAGLTLGIFHLQGHRLLGAVNAQGEYVLLNSYQPDKQGFGWEASDISGLVGLNLLSSPIRNVAGKDEQTFFLWTSRP